MRFYDLENAEELREELIEKLRTFDKEMNRYQTDVYLYVDEGSNSGTFEEFANIGGNCRIADDHYTIYSDKPHYEDVFNWYSTIADLAEALGMRGGEELKEIVFCAGFFDDISEVGYWEVIDYLEENEGAMRIFHEAFNELVDEADYEEIADRIIETFDEEQEFLEEE